MTTNGTNSAQEVAANQPLQFPAVPAREEDYVARIAKLELQVATLQAEQKRFMEALTYAGKFMFENPASKMLLMTLPKEMKERLTAFFASVK